ncbi:MAG: response regulator [Solirubrobacteraceae bacterium]|nr:response regulator [Solirubrobacteraceae bacterium]
MQVDRATIGFVEDSDDDFALLSRVFSEAWNLHRWSTGESAAQAFTGPAPHAAGVEVLLVDHDLPGMDGVAVIEHVRACMGANSPLVCMVSGTGRPGISESALAAGADAFFAKPNSVSGLRELAAAVAALAAAR